MNAVKTRPQRRVRIPKAKTAVTLSVVGALKIGLTEPSPQYFTTSPTSSCPPYRRPFHLLPKHGIGTQLPDVLTMQSVYKLNRMLRKITSSASAWYFNPFFKRATYIPHVIYINVMNEITSSNCLVYCS